MTLLILTLLATADENKTEIDFESVSINAQIKAPSFQRIAEVERPTFKPLSSEFCVRYSFVGSAGNIETPNK